MSRDRPFELAGSKGLSLIKSWKDQTPKAKEMHAALPCPMLIDQAQGDLRIASGKSYSRKRRDEASGVSASRSPDADAADFASRKSQLRRERPHPTSRKMRG